MKTKLSIMLLSAMAIFSTPVFALEQITAHVTMVEATYMPGRVTFQLDAGNATCPTGTYFYWAKTDTATNKAAYALLMTALVANKRVNVFINNADTTCNGQYLHLLSN